MDNIIYVLISYPNMWCIIDFFFSIELVKILGVTCVLLFLQNKIYIYIVFNYILNTG